MATIILPSRPIIVSGSDVEAELGAAAEQVQAATNEAYASRAKLGKEFDNFVAFHTAFHEWKSSIGATVLTFSIGTVGAWDQARDYRLRAIEWRKRIATLSGKRIYDPSANVEDPNGGAGGGGGFFPSWLPWVAGGIILVILLREGRATYAAIKGP